MNPRAMRRVATAVALGLLSASAWSATMMGNNSNKGSLLVFPRIDVTPGTDTLITLVNDSAVDVRAKCYYRSSEPVPTPLPSTFDTAFIKHTMDFTVTLTRNQPVTWSAATGFVLGGAGMMAQPFATWPDGSARTTGELKCFAIGANGAGDGTQINFNQLYGSAAIVDVAGQAWEYNAWAFQALGGTLAQGYPVGNTPGVLDLDGTLTGYDMCPKMLVGAFQPGGAPTPAAGPLFFNGRVLAPVFQGGLPSTIISIAGCNQDLTQRAQPFITKYTYTFWNEDEFSRTGTHECGDSYYETSLPASSGVGAAPNPGPFMGMPLAQYASLGTPTAYMRIESVADTFVCANAVQVGIVGVIGHANAGVYVRGTNLIGRGTQPGRMTFDPGPRGSFKM